MLKLPLPEIAFYPGRVTVMVVIEDRVGIHRRIHSLADNSLEVFGLNPRDEIRAPGTGSSDSSIKPLWMSTTSKAGGIFFILCGGGRGIETASAEEALGADKIFAAGEDRGLAALVVIPAGK